MTRVCSWCKCVLGESNDAGGAPTHGICPKCLLSILEQLETIASNQKRLLPVATWLIVVAADDPLLLQELQQRFSQSTLVRVIGDRRTQDSPLVSPSNRRKLGDWQERDRSSHGFFVVRRSDSPTTPNGCEP